VLRFPRTLQSNPQLIHRKTAEKLKSPRVSVLPVVVHRISLPTLCSLARPENVFGPVELLRDFFGAIATKPIKLILWKMWRGGLFSNKKTMGML